MTKEKQYARLFDMKILGIETSCDDTGIAILDIRDGLFRVEKNNIASQASLHTKYGGVVPEVAARKHVETIIPLLKETIAEHAPESFDAIAVTAGPGLVTSLQVGVETAKSLSYAWNVPLAGVNHIEGHLYSVLLNRHIDELVFPAVALVVSGGHTELILMRDHGDYALLGRTRDDAAGETFDKAATMLKLPYPGGPAITKQAEQGNAEAFALPHPMKDPQSLEFSFSGLKNAIRLLIEEQKQSRGPLAIADIAASVQKTIVDILVERSHRAVAQYNPKTFILAGGVAANPLLRDTLTQTIGARATVLMPEQPYTQDNAAMIAAAAYQQVCTKQFARYDTLTALSNWELVN